MLRAPRGGLARLLVLVPVLLTACDDGGGSDDSGAAGGASGGAAGGASGGAIGGSGGVVGGVGGAVGGVGGAVGGAAGGSVAGGGAAGGGGATGGSGGGAVGACAPPVDAPCDGGDERPPALNEHTAVYVDGRREMIIFGGNTAIPENCGFPAWVFHDETWIFYDYENACGRWTRVEGDAPPARGRHAAAFDGRRMWIHGGSFRRAGASSGRYTVRDDLWAFDPETRTWEEVSPEGRVPPGRYNATLVADPEGGALWLYAGNGLDSGFAPQVLGNLWRYDIESGQWTEVEVQGDAPRPRMWHAALHDPVRGRMVVFGGADEGAFSNDARYFNDVWAFDLEGGTWERLHEGGRTDDLPPGRFWATFVYDAAADRYLLFGGHDDGRLGNRNDVWAFDPESNAWTQLVPGDAFNRPANNVCDFPPDFATVDPDSPERRNAHSFAWSSACGHGLLFGGKTDCGAVDDVWRWTDDGWEEVVEATGGEVCHRWRSNPDNCADLCL